MGVTFDGPNKLIIVDNGTTSLNVRADIYSPWKRWTVESDNSKYLQAMRSVGGDPLPGNRALGDTYFLLNGWKIRPYEGDHRLTIEGNLYSEDGSEPVLDTLGSYRVTVVMTVSDLIVQVVTSGTTSSGSLTPAQEQKLNDAAKFSKLAALNTL